MDSQVTHEGIASVLTNLMPKLLRFAVSLTKNKDDAHDLVMDIFSKFLERFNEKKEFPDNLEAYLIVSIRNRFRDQGRRNRKQTSFDEIDDFFEPVDDTIPSDPFMKKRIANAFGKLTDTCHEILTLIANGYKYSEIKELTGKPINTIKSSVFKCREKFSTHLYGSERRHLGK